MLKKVYPSIRLSYDFLESDDEKSLLLLCSLFGEDRNIRVEDLMMCSVGLGMFADLPPLAHYVRMRVESLIIRLKARCLLLDGDRGDGVKMHDIIRDVALLIASEKGGMYSVILKKEDSWSLNMKKLRDSKVLSLLPHLDFNQLPERLECSDLELFLLLSGEGNSIPIPIPFFDDSKDRLKSLFFDRANLVTIPPSFHSLQNLQTLCLRGCVLEDVTFIGDLKNLQILDLSESTIMQLPVKVGLLSRLQMLNLEGCKDLKLIKPNVISSLIQLEELYMAKEFDKWEVGEVDVSERSNANLAEIENLQQLTSLSLRVPDAKTFPKDFKFSEKLGRYRISIGGPLYYSHPPGISRSLLLKLRERSQLTALGLESLMKRSEWLLFDGLIDVKNVVYDLDSEGFCDLKRLSLFNSDGVLYIVDCVDQQIHPHKAFPVLKRLRLEGLRNLERICHGELPEDSFKNLRDVTVWNCDKLKNVFPLSIFKRLHSIEVEDCKMMEEIVGHVRSEDDGAVQFPELRSLILRNLPKMVKFMSWSEAEAAGGSSSVESPDPFFSEKVVLPSLEYLYLYVLAVKKLWADQLPSTSYMQNLMILKVENCYNLKYVSSFATAKSCLIKLKELKVSRCRVLEEVLVITDLHGEDVGSLEKISLPQLKSLKLDDLPNLKRFCKGSDELETLVTSIKLIGERSKHEKVEFGEEEPFFSEMVALPSLEDLYLNNLVVKKLWADHIPTTSYMQNLSSLDVSNCNNLKYLSSFAAAKSCLIKLRKLKVSGCSVLEDVLIITDLQGEDDGSLQKISLPQVKSLDLYDLPNLKRFCKRSDELETLVTSTKLTCEGSEHEEVEFGTEQPFFSEMVALPSLEDLYLNNLVVKKLWADQIPATSHMQNLSSLDVIDCNNLKYVSSFATAKSFLIKLKELKVSRCSVLEEVLVITDLQGEDDGSLKKIALPQLKSLKLDDLPNLKRFCKHPDELEALVMSTELTGEGSDHEEVEFGTEQPFFSEMVALPSLEDLYLNNLVVKKLWADQTPATSYMQNLSSLDVSDCNNLKYMSSFATAKSFLIKLRKLKVSGCSVLEDVLVITDLQGEDDGSLEKISLPQLQSINLYDLPNLKRFCKRSDELETLVTSIELTGEGSEHEEVEFGTEQPFFNEMVVLPSLEYLTLYALGVKMLWADQLASTSYMPNLSSLYIRDCCNLKYVSSYATAKSCLIKLKKLDVYTCSVLEEVLAITDLQRQDDGSLEKISLPQLKSLTLYDLPYLKRFCKNPRELKMLETNSTSTEITVDRAEPEKMEFSANESLFNEMLEFPGLEKLDLDGLNAVESVWQLQTTSYMVNLTSLSVENCNSLKYLFSLAVAERLLKLNNLLVANCEVMEYIVATKKLGEEGRSGNKILFPQLESLTLSKLSTLRTFCHEEVILPKLESLSTDCGEVITKILGMSQSSSTLSLCNLQLKELELDFRNQDKPFALSICKLLHRCHNLEKLHLNGLLVNVICKDRQNEVGAAAQKYPGQLITRLRELRLDNIPKLRHLFGEPENDHSVGGALQLVKTMFVSFQNLTILKVSFCHRLTYLLASSTATSLVQLKEMRVTDCNRMTEIITDYKKGEITEGEHDCEFVFPQLEILVLRHLPNLGSFFSGNNVMSFPKLEKLFVRQCPEMRSFSCGIVISSSMLNTIIAEISSEWRSWDTNYLMNRAKAVREHWDGDVNTTVRQLWEDDSNLALQQLFAGTDVHYSGEGTSVTGY
ncbi:hypothetical protein TIFTF001_023695 [Ficus carica]|uniref:Disease resistance protein At4g27190-like leucine-rich repeats domain-containing protein n=1 Tax=Ficus carica TaxID=3494 RepID=A0AA88AV47_FICCA|nr:hypothetical protein TIFTF001_023695 [Ficus carica]